MSPSESTLRPLRDALAHHNLANQLDVQRRTPITVEPHSISVPRLYHISSAEAVGLPGPLLQRLFEQDQKVRGCPFFVDPLEARGYPGMLAYEDGLPLAGLDERARGLDVLTATATRYLVVATNETGVLGFTEFVIAFEYTDPCTTGKLSAGFAVDLERIYVCKHHRGLGVGTALLRYAAQAFGQELAVAANALTPFLSASGRPLELSHVSEAHWLSASGRLAHINLGYEMDAEIVMFEARNPCAAYFTHTGRTKIRNL